MGGGRKREVGFGECPFYELDPMAPTKTLRRKKGARQSTVCLGGTGGLLPSSPASSSPFPAPATWRVLPYLQPLNEKNSSWSRITPANPSTISTTAANRQAPTALLVERGEDRALRQSSTRGLVGNADPRLHPGLLSQGLLSQGLNKMPMTGVQV